MVLLLDNHDSFTHILASYLRRASRQEVIVTRRAPDSLSLSDFAGVVLSPGPGIPSEHQEMMRLIGDVAKTDLPMLGVCLGMQAMWEHGGGALRHIGRVVHGEASALAMVGDDPMWVDLTLPVMVGRYHSWAVDPDRPAADYVITAWDDEQVPMAMRHSARRWLAVQFHPESYMTKQGAQMLDAFFYEMYA